MIPRLKPAFGASELLAALDVFRPHAVEQFESGFAELAGQRHAIAFPYGRTSLLAIFKALGIKNRDVICPAYTCVVVPHAIVISGNRPVFVDSEAGDMNMDLALLDEAVTDETAAIVSTSIFGHPVDLNALDHVSAQNPDIPLLQDCAHSFFCDWDARPVHAAGLCAFFGLNISKIMSSIFGGMVTTDDDQFADSLRSARAELIAPSTMLKSLRRVFYLLAVYPAFTRLAYGTTNRMERSGLLNQFVKYYDPGIIDMPSDYLESLTPVEARVGLAQCGAYPDIVRHRRRLARIYREGLAEDERYRLPPDHTGCTYSHFVVRTGDAEMLCERARRQGVQFGDLIEYHIPSMTAYADCRSFDRGVSGTLPGQVINLPVHRGCHEADARRIVDLLLSDSGS
ncbi:MAG: DegT/DnrJ/EryC1/StrS aminotransferase family protein [Pseudomonadota bacterium]